MELPENLEEAWAQLTELWHDAAEIWAQGGWAMIAIAIIALALSGLGVHIWIRLRATRFRSVPERKWRRWIDEPELRRGPVGRLLDFVSGARSLKELGLFFDQLRMTEITAFERDLRVMKICVSAAPLVGLLGTVTGMLTTFGALSTGSGGDKTMAMIAGGISEALITTETGLIIALPGLFFQYQLNRTFERYKAFLAQLESVCTQKLYARLREKGELRPRRPVASNGARKERVALPAGETARAQAT